MNFGNDKINQQVKDILDKIHTKVSGLDTRSTYILFGGILGVILLLDFLIIMGPLQLGTLNSMKPKIGKLDEDIKKAKDDLKHEPQYNKEINHLKEEVRTINLKVKSREEVPMILERISRVADEFDIKIDEIMPDPNSQKVLLKNNDGQYFSLPIIIQAHCGYHNFGKFINKIETEDVYLSIADFAFGVNPSDPKKHGLRMTIQAVIFAPLSELPEVKK